ncbi:HECT [Macleaya cordata]|uniref:HECT-type E3 ubiquitin transferase n=1 Tax=Macleaya cordata TaxID=56857 RepID=A0A200QHP3_MACCD|nr:HECT [Macleaya cordata]
MENRGRKRTESADQLPSDKRACSISSELKPGSSNSSLQTHMGSNTSVSEHQDCEMEASSSASISGRSDGGETEKDSSTYGSCDSDGLDESEQKQRSHHHEYNPRRYSGDQEKFKKILSNLTDESSGPSGQLAALTQLCDVLSFCTDSSISSYTADSLSPVLVRLANHETNPDIMLLAIRAITYLCDVLPRSSAFLVRHDAVNALCARLMAIEYLDVAEQCLLALEKISLDQPLACLQAGAVMAVLNYIDFFSSSVQRVAINIVANICKKLPSDSSSHFMDAVPVLCNLLQYEDQKLVENIATCLIRITETVSHSSEMVDELCKHGLIHQVIPLIALNSQTSLSQSTYARLIGLLSRLASGSVAAVRTLLELNISCTLKNILSSYDASHSTSSALVDNNIIFSQVNEVLKLLNVLLPPLGGKSEDNLVLSEKEKILKEQPELLRRFGLDILPVLIQVVNGGANLHVCYGCVSVINKLVYVSRSDMLLDLLKNTNISSFLAGVFSRKDHHVLISALNIVETILQELPDFYLNPFMKEGVVYAIDAILTPERFSHFMFPSSCSSQLSSSSHKKLNAKDAARCLCYNLNIGQPRSSEKGTCKLEKDSIHTLAKHIKATYFATELNNSEIGLTETLQKLRNFGAVLNDMVNLSMNTDICAEQEENLFHILCQIMMELSGGESVSTFEFIESGIVKSLLNYFSNGQYLKGKVDRGLSDYPLVVLKRFAMFASFSLSSMSLHREGMPLAVLIRKLQIALSSLENFPVILNQFSKPRNTYAAIPIGHYTTHPCLRVRFVKEEGETVLCDYSADVVNIEPFTSLDAIERFLWPKVSTSRDEDQITSAGKCTTQSEDIPLPLPSDARSPKGKDTSSMEEIPDMQDFAKPEQQFLPAVNATMKTQNSVNASTSCSASTSEEYPGSHSSEDTPRKLIFCLDGRQLDQTLTLYQAILRLQVKEEHDMIAGRRFWNEVYEVTYRKAAESMQTNLQDCLNGTQISDVQNYPGKFWGNVLCFSSMLTAELPYNLEKSDPVYEILFLLKILEVINKFLFHLMSHERVKAFAEGKSDDLDTVAVKVCPVPQSEFVSSKLTEKLEQQMGDSLAVSAGAVPSWCSQLIGECPFLFSFEARCKYFLLTAFGSSRVQPHPSLASDNNNLSATSDRRSPVGSLPRKKFQVNRSHILGSAAQMMDLHAHQKVTLEVEYSEEVGTGLGPTMEFYTLVSHEFQKVGLGMWREDRSFPNSGKDEEPGFVVAPSGLFPRPWSSSMGTSNGIHFSEVIKKFALLGKVVAKALQDGRVLDLPLSKAFYKLLLDQELNIYDIQSIDPGLGRVLLEFQALVERKRILNSAAGSNSTFVSASCFRNTKIDDLCLDFTLPGDPDYILTSEPDRKMVNMSNLEEYVSLIVDATVNCGISRQVEAFKSGFNQVFPIKSLKIFTEEEIERLLCGERDAWTSNELLDHIKFDHGYTVSSPPIIYLLEIIKEFGREQQQAFVQFVTGAPRLPHGGLAALNPKMTIVRKHSNEWVDGDLPSVMTCANYLKLPPYSSKDIMKERLLYAITEGQGSFHLS